MNPATIATTVAVAKAALDLGLELTEQLGRISAEGGDVPGLDELRALRDTLRALPDLAPQAEGGEG